MLKQKLTINGNNFFDLETFFAEIDNVFTKGSDWQAGHNMNAFNDLLRGGFGVYEYEEPVDLFWINFSKSKIELGSEQANDIVDLIRSHNHIVLTLIN